MVVQDSHANERWEMSQVSRPLELALKGAKLRT